MEARVEARGRIEARVEARGRGYCFNVASMLYLKRVVFMARKSRRKSESGIYHIILRGINHQNIFEDDEDKHKLIEALVHYKEICEYQLYAFCLMNNHFHLLLKVGTDPLEQIMRRICGSYVYWYNKKYQRIGNLFQDRFKSEPIEDDKYFFTVLRYIHQNPIKAGITKDMRSYQWSSYIDYIENRGLTDSESVLKMFNEDESKAIKIFIKFTEEKNDDECLEIEEKTIRLTDDELTKIIEEKFKIKAVMIQNKPKEEKEKILKELLKINGASTRQIARVTGISANVLWRL